MTSNFFCLDDGVSDGHCLRTAFGGELCEASWAPPTPAASATSIRSLITEMYHQIEDQPSNWRANPGTSVTIPSALASAACRISSGLFSVQTITRHPSA